MADTPLTPEEWLAIADREPPDAWVSAGTPTPADQALMLCYAIEALPASDQQTQCSVLASALLARVRELEAENRELRDLKNALMKRALVPTLDGP